MSRPLDDQMAALKRDTRRYGSAAEPPLAPDLRLDSAARSAEELAEAVLQRLLRA